MIKKGGGNAGAETGISKGEKQWHHGLGGKRARWATFECLKEKRMQRYGMRGKGVFRGVIEKGDSSTQNRSRGRGLQKRARAAHPLGHLGLLPERGWEEGKEL